MINLFYTFAAILVFTHAGEERLFGDVLEIEEEVNSSTGAQRVSFGRETGVKKGDMILTEEQDEWLFGDNEEKSLHNSTTGSEEEEEEEVGHRKKRSGVKFDEGFQLWPNGVIPYIIQRGHFNSDEIDQIKEAMEIYEELTCIKFVPRLKQNQWIHIQHTDKGCFSMVGNGRTHFQGGQPLSLQKPGCRTFGTYLHELGHAIGLVHEHQLPTRDNHIRYYATNVNPNLISQLRKYHPRVINTYNTPYDLGSIMHYDVMAFSIDDMSMTLGVDNPWLIQHIGRKYSNMLSFGDIRTVNHLYQCADHCSRLRKFILGPCPSPGFRDRKCKCVTPASYHHKYCRDEPGFESWCATQAPVGDCNIENIEYHKTCRKTCGFCPIFKPGDTAIGPVQMRLANACVDRYHNPLMCQAWKRYCTNSRWMHRYCRLTCGACKSEWGDCVNYDPDSICDLRRINGMCNANLKKNPNLKVQKFVKVRCADSCGKCGFRNQDYSCRNNNEDRVCDVWAREAKCEREPGKMYTQCASTCNRCYLNKGNCANLANEKECLIKALQNYCIATGEEADRIRLMCGKTCNTCNRQG